MSPIISVEQPSKYVTVTVKMPEELDKLIDEYTKANGLYTKSAAMRELIGLALGEDLSINSAVRANAEAKALAQLSDALDEALITFRKLVE